MSVARVDRCEGLSLLLLVMVLLDVESQSESATEASGTLLAVAEDLRLGRKGTLFSR